MHRKQDSMDRERNGFTLSEMLTVIGIIALVLLVSLPALGERYRGYRVRTVANELSSDLRAARYTAITTRGDVDFNISTESDTPPNRYSYTTAKGDLRLVEVPDGIQITSTSANPITFTRNGALADGAESLVLESQVSSDRIDQYTLSISAVGVVSVDYSAVAP